MLNTYIRSFGIMLLVFFSGIILDLIFRSDAVRFAFPQNIVLGIVFIFLLFFLHLFYGIHPLIRWFTSVPVALAAITGYMTLSLLMGLIPQKSPHEGLLAFFYIRSSWLYFFVNVFFLFILGLTMFKRLIPFRLHNAGFILNHAGLFVVILSGALSYGDQQRMTMILYPNEWNRRAGDNQGNSYDLNVAFKLRKFIYEEYPLQLILTDSTGEVQRSKKGMTATIDSNTNQVAIDRYTIVIDTFCNKRFFPGKAGRSFHLRAVYIHVFRNSDSITSGWIVAGNRFFPPALVRTGKNELIGFSRPASKRFASELTLMARDGKTRDVLLEVNKPFTLDGWKIYQSGYDETVAGNSYISIIELVSDPWIIAVYVGMFMLLGGAIIMLIQRKKQYKDDSAI